MISFTEVAKQRQLQKIRRRGLVEQAAQPTPGATWAKCWMYTAPWKRSIVAGTIISGFTYKSIAVTIFVSNQFDPSEYKDWEAKWTGIQEICVSGCDSFG
jgi:hypothetical protein